MNSITIPKNKESEHQKINYFILIDNSGSIYSSVNALKQTVSSVHKNMNEGDTISIGRFSGRNSNEWFVRGASKSANIAPLIETKIYSSGLTHFNKPLEELRDVVIKDVTLLSGSFNNVFYFLSDGYSNDQSPEDVTLRICDALNNKFSSKTIVGYGSYYNRSLLLDMADRIGGTFNHVSSYQELKDSGEILVKNKKTLKTIDLPKNYDLVWQVTSNEVIPLVSVDSKVSVLETNEDAELFAVDYSELDSLPQEHLSDMKFVASLAMMLSQKSKANLAVSLLRKAGLPDRAKKLQKAFTVTQKGKEENALKTYALNGGKIIPTLTSPTIPIKKFLEDVKNKISDGLYINLNSSKYRSISRKGEDSSKVAFDTIDELAKVINITGNENRANISFLTVRNGEICQIVDPALKARVVEFNSRASKKIELPIKAPTFRNYALIANGDFNFETITFSSNSEDFSINPSELIDIFDEDVKSINIKDFTGLYKTLIAEKAHASVLRYYIKNNSSQKHSVDKRVEEYGEEGAKLLEEMGLDYEMRYSPKTEYKEKDEDADYIPFLEITAQLKGAATINAKASYEKKVKNGKQNPGDVICWPLFDKYDSILNTMSKEDAVAYFKNTLESIENVIEFLSQKISSMKFFLMVTNSWFEGIEKADEIEYDGLVIKTKETKEYL